MCSSVGEQNSVQEGVAASPTLEVMVCWLGDLSLKETEIVAKMIEKISAFLVFLADIKVTSEEDHGVRISITKFFNNNRKFGKFLHELIFQAHGGEVHTYGC